MMTRRFVYLGLREEDEGEGVNATDVKWFHVEIFTEDIKCIYLSGKRWVSLFLSVVIFFALKFVKFVTTNDLQEFD